MTLRAGAAVADITPAKLSGLNAMGDQFLGMHDRLHARALIVEDRACVAIVSLDLLEVGDTTGLRERIRALGIDGTLIVATHSHNAPRAGVTPPGGLSRPPSPESLTYTDWLWEQIVAVVAAARAAMVPARFGTGRGEADINVNRDEFRDGWTLGQNPDGPSDKALTVLAFADLEHSPIATLLGYAVHPTVSLGTRLLGADLAGATTRRVEDAVGGVCLWLPGSLGDQAPRNSRESLGCPPDAVVYAALDEQAGVLAAESAWVVRGIDNWRRSAPVSTWTRRVDSPAKRGTGLAADMRQDEVSAVCVLLTEVTLGDTMMIGVGGEVTTPAAAELLAAAAPTDAVIVSLANERIGYLADPDAFGRGTFAARGCPVTEEWLPNATAAIREGSE
ncbi:MAG: hypothetical protein LBK95_06435 [Bifidobacteriaceae bacterium]|jgi:hypothetical protein|nr:hypothetical protein [Bifidobacteriaceae bacterium]